MHINHMHYLLNLSLSASYVSNHFNLGNRALHVRAQEVAARLRVRIQVAAARLRVRKQAAAAQLHIRTQAAAAPRCRWGIR